MRSLPDVLRQKPCLPGTCEPLPVTVLPKHLPHLPFRGTLRVLPYVRLFVTPQIIALLAPLSM